ncbi:MAG TPA: hypothetical protein PK275_12830 [Chitinophagaceae bacterium]|nr:hypothetical protein [Chitinophagaceae bacterium]
MLTQQILKSQVIQVIQAMPQQEFLSIDEVIEELLLFVKTNEGISDMNKGEMQPENIEK